MVDPKDKVINAINLELQSSFKIVKINFKSKIVSHRKDIKERKTLSIDFPHDYCFLLF